MRNLFVTAAALLMLSAAPAFAMSCCGGGKGAMMCEKNSLATSHAGKAKKGRCCCEGMKGGNMSKRT